MYLEFSGGAAAASHAIVALSRFFQCLWFIKISF